MEYRTDCPFCGKKNHLYINQEKGVFHCFKCKRGGRLSGGLTGLVPQETVESSVSPQKGMELKGLRLITKKDELYWNYAKQRNALKFKHCLYTCDNFPEYIIIGLPIVPVGHRHNFFMGRKLLLTGPRYRYFNDTKGVIAKSFEGKVKEGLIVEGFFDLCRASEVKPTIALLGKGWDDIKIKEINKSITQRIHICLDKDALVDSITLCSYFPNRDISIIHSDVFKDPGEGSSWISRKLSLL